MYGKEYISNSTIYPTFDRELNYTFIKGKYAKIWEKIKGETKYLQ